MTPRGFCFLCSIFCEKQSFMSIEEDRERKIGSKEGGREGNAK